MNQVQRRTIDILVKNLEAAEAELDAQDTRLKLQLREKALSSMKSKSDRELDGKFWSELSTRWTWR